MYRDKDYAAECDFLAEVFARFADAPVRDIIDLGCGTGGHAIPLAGRGYEVFGVDRSAEMIAIARTKSHWANHPAGLCFKVADICQLDLGRTFDAAICMFAVLGYQTSNDALINALGTARRHLRPGSLYVCDVWYGPAVLIQQPRDRVKIVREGSDRVIRLTSASHDLRCDVVRVSFRILRLRNSQVVEDTEEVHPMRYFFLPELEYYLSQTGFDLVTFCAFGKLDEIPRDTNWNVSVIARAR